ncbi:ADP-ribosyl cyclase/cyclic ADP-ribose hydrolase 1 [Trichechus manatus latirostris]|uniref:ADP-ribosyl cyclase/cyclic ADP-ribose hydrolase 1 n=1 Tax=Trichechus manatus latirostris TaxID=127582 RepID=A0A2Y9G1W5_TRIMA|nr:ADP-ribosyl cyclase/cyclic ADP-ribose hydrolase 1 [Trichechus manatus latirostris]
MAPWSSSSRGRRVCCCVLIGLGVLVLGAAVTAGIRRWLQPSGHKQWEGAGTTAHISEIFLGRCFTYTQIIHPELRDKNCQKIWNAFKNSFISKDTCNITEEDYQPLIKLTTQTLPCNQTLFWSKTNVLVHRYTKAQKELFTLEDTLLGYMADDLIWCGSSGNSEMNYQSCPSRMENCSNSPVFVFWKTVSKKFAEAACGVVHVMLNGSISRAFVRNSIFGSIEVMNLHQERVHSLRAWVMHDIGGDFSDSCSGSSINDLRSIMREKNIPFTCQDDYKPVRYIQCVSHPEHSSCP